MNDYLYIPGNHPDNVAHGGVGLLYKSSLPLKNRPDLAFEESIVVQLTFGRKKIFFTVLYRSPSMKRDSPEFASFLTKFKNLHTSIEAENPYASFFTGDFNGNSQFWWGDRATTPEGNDIEEL